MKKLSRTELEILKVILNKELSECIDAFYQCERGNLTELCHDFRLNIEGIKENLKLLDELLQLQIDEKIIYPSVNGCSDYYGISKNCGYRKHDNQELCKVCKKMDLKHYEKETK